MSQSTTPAVPAVQHPTSDRAAAPAHILLADGDERSRDHRGSQLRSSGYQVSAARTGFEAIVKACCHLPDLIVLDDSLGENELRETARLLATCPVTAHIPVVRIAAGNRIPRRVLTWRHRAASRGAAACRV
jgi:CheY-like chemotaxis protein